MDFDALKKKALAVYEYCREGVWQDTRPLWWVRLAKIANLTVRGFLDGGLQNKACAMTYRTLLALVPLLALLFAIGRGFGLGDYLQRELLSYFPSQHRALEVAFRFVDSYLAQTSEGLFVGVGIIFLLWTLISLLSSAEEIFNSIWNVKDSRTLWRKLADYTAILLILPVLMICSSGISIFMSTTLQRLLDFDFLTPLLSVILDCASVVLSWLFFAGCYMLIPNTRVKPLNALVAGVLAGTGFQALQWLFVTGQMYVAKYNAIYGSFSFLPLMLIWLQLVWLITFVCAGICYSSQNIFRYSFESHIKHISVTYRMKVILAILTVIVKRFKDGLPPLSAEQIINQYELPPRLVDDAVSTLLDASLICHVVGENGVQGDLADMPLQPTREPAEYRMGKMIFTLNNHGISGFIPGFSQRFDSVEKIIDSIENHLLNPDEDVELASIEISDPQPKTEMNKK